jgi:hypothetical protein
MILRSTGLQKLRYQEKRIRVRDNVREYGGAAERDGTFGEVAQG